MLSHLRSRGINLIPFYAYFSAKYFLRLLRICIFILFVCELNTFSCWIHIPNPSIIINEFCKILDFINFSFEWSFWSVPIWIWHQKETQEKRTHTVCTICKKQIACKLVCYLHEIVHQFNIVYKLNLWPVHMQIRLALILVFHIITYFLHV